MGNIQTEGALGEADLVPGHRDFCLAERLLKAGFIVQEECRYIDP